MLTAEHLDDKEIIVPIAIDVRHVHRHRGGGHVAPGGGSGSAKMSPTVVQPKTVMGVGEITAHIEVGCAVAIQVAGHHREAPILGWRGERLARLVEERAAGPGHRGEFSAAIVPIKNVRFAFLDGFDAAVGSQKTGETVFG